MVKVKKNIGRTENERRCKKKLSRNLEKETAI
jgi:hypothetical protein